MIEIIPAIDIIEGKCVRLSQGDYSQKKIYNESPLEVAKQFEDAGIKRLHLVDLDGAKKGTIVNQKVLENIASKTKLVIDFGGGIKTDVDITSVYNAGASIATIGSIAIKNPTLFFMWVKKYGSEKILLGADVKNEKIVVSGWTEQTEISVINFINTNSEKGVKNIFCTDISKDGMMQGASIELYKKIKEEVPTINLIASGGVSSIENIEAVRQAGCSGAIIGKAIYEGTIILSDLKPYLF
ncbi:MAG: 1-(5-phosphoribosyl)-5-[(5-phosphoribosylamino)methylideneamino]imidazole-4-carboxamide isomerase [Bacteroidetes bacterium]|nr:1-(5-phosphoribosyl)-5-[(5-phosphoribosylamino)methylideneamino]imidazole-4-carboxamide isomerase [Bacteroidota bacterium]